MERHYFGLATLVVSVALLIWSIGETFAFPQGPNVSMGSNPIVSFRCQPGGSAYTVPSNYDLVITDVTVYQSQTLLANGVGLLYASSGMVTFNTGWRASAGSIIQCGSGDAYYSGYLTHQ